MTTVGTVRIFNPAPISWFAPQTVGLPFARGAWDGKGHIAIGTTPAVVHHRTHWEDGSVRFAAASWTPHIGEPSFNRPVAITSEAPPPFTPHDAIIDAAAGFSIHARPYTLRNRETLFASPIARRYRLTYTGPQGWLWVTIELRSRSAVARLWLDWGWSDPSTFELTHGSDVASIDFHGAEPVIWHADRYDHRVLSSGNASSLFLDHCPADGQAQHREGYLLFPPDNCRLAQIDYHAAKVGVPPAAISLDWVETGALTPLGSLAGAEGSVEDAVAVYRAGERGSWDAPALGMRKYPGGTGAQNDIGVANPWVLKAAHSGRPEYLPAIGRSVAQEACRPVHHREADGRPFRHANHPQAFFWDERPHAHDSVSPDQLGKILELSQRDADGWTGFDRQHQMRNLSAGYALLSGDPGAIERCDLEAERWLAAHPVEAPSPVLTGIGDPRAARSLWAGTQLLWVTGREDLAQRIHDRIAVNHVEHFKREPSPHIVVKQEADSRVPFDPPFHFPWQAATHCWCVSGALMALAKHGKPLPDEHPYWSVLAGYEAAVLKHGMREASGTVEVGKSQETDPRMEAPDGVGETEWWTGYATWVLPFVQIMAAEGNSKAERLEEMILEGGVGAEWRLR